MFKKLLALFLTLGLILGLMGCGQWMAQDPGDMLGDVIEQVEDALPDDSPSDEDFPSEEDFPLEEELPPESPTPEETVLAEDGRYYSKEDVALYLYTYGYLPANFITKDEARALGWEGGSVENYAPGCAIGGDRFGNREGLLPEADGRIYYECDIDTDGASSRGAKRIVFSNDGLIYYTEDHYESFELLYGEE